MRPSSNLIGGLFINLRITRSSFMSQLKKNVWSLIMNWASVLLSASSKKKIFPIGKA